MKQALIALLGIIILFTTATTFAGNCGDVNSTGTVNALDITYLINFLYKHGPAPNPLKSGDVNNSGTVNALDITYLINFLYKHGPAPNCPPELPALTTASVSSITQTTAECGGTITSDGGAAVTARGVCWSTNPTPTIADNKTIDGSGTGSFISSITALTGNTLYYVRAYATNSAGDGYGNEVSFATNGTVTDIDGNVYPTVKIGNQWWMAVNLKVTHYRNGEAIPNVTDNATWQALTTGAYCEYNNDINNFATYGHLYNWYTVADSRNIAPTGWHVSTDAEFEILTDYLGGYAIAGNKLRESGTTHWGWPNTGATNESGFTGLPGGWRLWDGTYNYITARAYFWSSTGYSFPLAWSRYLYYDGPGFVRGASNEGDGFSIRCVKD